eukprot:Colp12_sorted_trinity150504_noHs@19875
MSSTGGDYNPNPVREVETKEEVKQEKYENYDNQWSQQQLPKESYSNGAGDETVKSQAPPGEQLSQENGTSTQQTDNKQTATLTAPATHHINLPCTFAGCSY